MLPDRAELMSLLTNYLLFCTFYFTASSFALKLGILKRETTKRFNA